VPEKYWDEISGFATEKLGDFYTVKEPSYASEAELDYISELVSGMEKAVILADGINPDSGKSYMDYIDMWSFAQKYVLEELCKNNGGGATSPGQDASRHYGQLQAHAMPVSYHFQSYVLR